MKKSFTHICGLFLATGCILSLASCHNDDDVLQIKVNLAQTEIDYNPDGVWSGLADNQPFQSQYMVFSHAGGYDAPGTLEWEGFTPSRVKADNNALSQFAVMSGGGVAGEGTPYIVASWNTQENSTTPASARSCRIYYAASVTGEHYKFRPLSVFVTNTVEAYNKITESFTDKDYLVLVAHGVYDDGTERQVKFLLASSDDNGKLEVVDTWNYFNLTELGEVNELYFTMYSSQNNEWGMTAPSYFAIDGLAFAAKLPGK